MGNILIPAVKRLFGKRRRLSTVCLCLTLVISAMLLALFCMNFAQSLAGMHTLRESYDAYVNTHGKGDATDPFRVAVRDVLTVALAEIVTTHVLMLLLWLLLSVAGVAVVLSEAVGSETYIYALYVIYGADPKRLRRQIYGELLVVGLPALVLGILGAVAMGYYLLSLFTVGFFVVLEVVVLYGLLTLLCATAVTRRIFGQTCVKLLSNADTSAYIHSPRKSRIPRKIHKQGGFYYAVLSFVRMRKYHLVRGFSLCLVGATLFVLSGLTLPDTYAKSGATHEFTLTLGKGVSGQDLQETYLPAIEYCNGVVSATATAGDAAHRLGPHTLLEEHELTGHTSQTVYTGDRWAFDTLKIASADGNAYAELGGDMTVAPPYDKIFGSNQAMKGYSLDAMPQGTAVYVYPVDGPQKTGMVGSFVDVSLPDGGEGYDPYGRHITVEVIAEVEVTHLFFQPDPLLPFTVDLGARITEDYLFVNPIDYGKLRGETYVEDATNLTQPYPEDMGLQAGECYLLLPPDMAETYKTLETLTLLTPETPLIEAFEDPKISAGVPNTLPTDTYAINKTIHQTGVYLGNKDAFLSEESALVAMSQCISSGESSQIMPMAYTEYTVKARRRVEGLTSPCVVFVSDEYTTFTTWESPMTSLVLGSSVVLETDEEILEKTDPDDLPILESPHSNLYFATCEGLVLQTDDRDNPTYQVGKSLFLGTDVPKDFYNAMKTANIPIRGEAWQYKFTEGYVRGVFDLATGGTFLLWEMSPTSALSLSHYPPVMTGVSSYIPVTDVTSNSILSPSEHDMMLVMDDTGNGSPDVNATRLLGKYAYNDFVLCPDFEMPDIGKLPVGEAVLLLPEGNETLDISLGKVLQLGVYQPLGLAADDPLLYNMDALTLLETQLATLSYDYHGVRVSDIQTRRDVTSPTLVLSEHDFCQVTNKEGAVSEALVYVDADIPLEDLGELQQTLQNLLAPTGGSLTMHNKVLRSRATGTQRYVSVLHSMLVPLSTLLPLLLLSSAYALSLRRREEWQAYVASGGHRKRHISMCLWEGVLKCILYGVCYLVLCPLTVLLVMLIGGKLQMPFTPDLFHIENFLLFLGILLLSVVVTSLIPLLDMPPQFKKRKSNREKGDLDP